MFIRTSLMAAIVALVATTGLALHVGRAQLVGALHIDPQRYDLSVTGREVVQMSVVLGSEKKAARHSHEVEEVIYVLEGEWEFTLEGRPPATLKAGEVLCIPAGTLLSARNVGTDRAKELATYIVEGQAADRACELCH